ncbi:MAG: hypothetical protein H6706_24645 [Myxococcales bacterium]|nr:hypothetical protein [Myxococcales bacterium]
MASPTRPESPDAPRAARHARAARRYGRLRARVEGAITRIAIARFVAFAVAAITGFAAIYDRAPTYGAVAGVAALAFVVAVWLHRRPYAMAPRIRSLQQIHTEADARLSRRYGELVDEGARFLRADQPFRSELQLFGLGSVFQIANRAALPAGRDRLAELLAAPVVAPADLPARQAAAAELAPLTGWRHRLESEGRLVAVDDETLARFLAWAEAPGDLHRWLRPFRLAAMVLVPAAWLQMVATFTFDRVTLWWQTFALVGVLFAITTKRLQSTYLHLLGEQHRPFVALRRMFTLFEGRRFRQPLLAEMQGRLGQGSDRPSARMARLESTVESLAIRQGELMFGLVNLAFAWEIFHAWRLEGWRVANGARLRADLALLADLEALASFGALAHDHPDWCWPTVHADDARPPIAGEALGHPLFDPATRVANDFELARTGQLVLITGSNMSGKSSFLRTVGINAVLAQAGAPACARSLTLRACVPESSIQVTDDPREGLSRFYAEVKRIAGILRAVAGSEADAAALPRLYLVDEILSGTNSRERHLASRTIVARLLEARRSFGLVTTHDLELASLAEQRAVPMYHFSDRFDGEALHFDHRLRPGVATTTNALHVLRLEGITVEES